jgi:hypothetical protein
VGKQGFTQSGDGLWVPDSGAPPVIPEQQRDEPGRTPSAQPSPVLAAALGRAAAPPETAGEVLREVRSEAWWVSVALTILASSGVAGVVTAVLGAGAPGLADMNDGAVIARAGFATLGLTCGVFLAAYLWVSGWIEGKGGYVASATVAACLLAGNLVAAMAGRFASGAVLTRASPNGFAEYIGRVLSDNVATFGPVPTVSGVVVGIATARWAWRLYRVA